MEAVAELKNLCIYTDHQQKLVDNSSFALHAGKTLCLIGESGSGKTLTGKALLGMLPRQLKMSGELLFQGQNTNQWNRKRWQSLRGKSIGVIYQHPEQALHPAIPVGRQLTDLLRSHSAVTRHEAQYIAGLMLGKVALRDVDRIMNSYPFQLSGGMNQRVMIAMALLLNPQLLIADEPTSALDDGTQREIMTLLQELVADGEMSMLFITHDLKVAYELGDTIAVMRQGVIVEQDEAKGVLTQPKHAYTQQLLHYHSKFITQ